MSEKDMIIGIFAVVGGGLLLWSSWQLYSITKRTSKNGTFCGRKPEPKNKDEIHVQVEALKKKE